MYIRTCVYKAINDHELMRYNVLERLPDSGFYVISADHLRFGERSGDEYLDDILIERILEIDPGAVIWHKTMMECILAHDSNFAE